VEWSLLYTACFALGLTVVVASFALGHVSGGHGEGGHLNGHLDGGHLDGATDASGHPSDPHAEHGPSLPLLSPTVLAAFTGMFGAGGLLFHKALGIGSMPLHVLGAAGTSLVSGLGMAFAMRQIVKVAETNTLASFRDAVGREVDVLTPIKGRDLGEIAYVSAGSRQTLIARSADGADYATGQRVAVLDIREGIAYVGPPGTRQALSVTSVPAENQGKPDVAATPKRGKPWTTS
jgi:hypothetical protein